MIKKCLIVFFVLKIGGYINAQSTMLNAKTANEIINKKKLKEKNEADKPIPYGYVNDRDILWSKVVWEVIDLRQKINLSYYFPIDTTNISSSRRSLFHVLLKNIRNGKIKDVYSNSFFTSKITLKEINSRLINIRDENGYKDTFRIQNQDIESYMIRGIWYFDKRMGELKYRLLAIAPMAKDVQTIGVSEIKDEGLYELFWVFYPAAREVLHKAKVFNPKNASHPISFDHMLNARRFSSVIIREENVYGNRAISDYIKDNSLFRLLEANKIKEEIRNREIDMWNY